MEGHRPALFLLELLRRMGSAASGRTKFWKRPVQSQACSGMAGILSNRRWSGEACRELVQHNSENKVDERLTMR